MHGTVFQRSYCACKIYNIPMSFNSIRDIIISYTLRFIVFSFSSTSNWFTCTSTDSVFCKSFTSLNEAPSSLFKSVVFPAPPQPTIIQRAWRTTTFSFLRNFLSSSWLKFSIKYNTLTYSAHFIMSEIHNLKRLFNQTHPVSF